MRRVGDSEQAPGTEVCSSFAGTKKRAESGHEVWFASSPTSPRMDGLMEAMLEPGGSTREPSLTNEHVGSFYQNLGAGSRKNGLLCKTNPTSLKTHARARALRGALLYMRTCACAGASGGHDITYPGHAVLDELHVRSIHEPTLSSACVGGYGYKR